MQNRNLVLGGAVVLGAVVLGAAASRVTKAEDADKPEVTLRVRITVRGRASTKKVSENKTDAVDVTSTETSKDEVTASVEDVYRWKVIALDADEPVWTDSSTNSELLTKKQTESASGGGSFTATTRGTRLDYDKDLKPVRVPDNATVTAGWTYSLEPDPTRDLPPRSGDPQIHVDKGTFEFAAAGSFLGYVTDVLKYQVKHKAVLSTSGGGTSEEATGALLGAAVFSFDTGVGEADFEKKLAGTFKPNASFTATGGASRNFSTQIPGDKPGDLTDMTGTLDVSYVLSYGRPSPKYEMTIEPMDAKKVDPTKKGYDEWIPVPAGTDPKTRALFGPSTPLVFFAEIKSKSGLPDKEREGKIHFWLTDVSRHRGQCCNYPKTANTDPEKPDLRFAALQADSRVVVDETNPQHAYTTDKTYAAAVIVEATDAGAYGRIRADCPDHGLLAIYKVTGDLVVSIPKDDNHNDIADQWERDQDIKHRNYGGEWDFDGEPAGHATDGDGIPLYKEYRGFVFSEAGREKYARLSPKTKEMFVTDATGLFDPALWKACSDIVALALPRELLPGAESAKQETDRLRAESGNWQNVVTGKRADKIVDGNSASSDPGSHKYVVTILEDPVHDKGSVFGSTFWFPSSTPPHARRTPILVFFPARIAHKVSGGFIDEVLQTAVAGDAGALKLFTDAGITDPKVLRDAWSTVVAGRSAGGEADVVKKFIRRFQELTVIHELGHATGIDGHRKYGTVQVLPDGTKIADPEFDGPEKTCPMCYFGNHDNRHATIDELLHPSGARMPMLQSRSRFCKSGFSCWAAIDLKDED